MKNSFINKAFLLISLLILSSSISAQLKLDANNRLIYGNTSSHHDGYKYYDVTLKGNLWLVCPANSGNFFQIDTNPAATRLASHYDQVIFYNTQTGIFNSIQVKNVYNYSDTRAKKNIQSLNNGLKCITKLNPVSYNFNDNADNIKFRTGGDGKEIGLLAQEVEAVLPNVVLTDDEGKKLINYTALIPVLIDAIKSLQQEIETLKQNK